MSTMMTLAKLVELTTTRVQAHHSMKIADEVTGELRARYDPSHDWTHIERVVGIAHRLLEVELTAHPEIHYKKDIVTLGALVHNVGDRKCLLKGQTGEDGDRVAAEMLLSLGAEESVAQAVQVIANGVSYTQERKNPERTQQLIKEHPELAIVQDADRLDALGAHGIARLFTFNGARGNQIGNMDATLEHVNDKLLQLAPLMKTEEGKRLGEKETNKLRTFVEWWAEEIAVSGQKRGEESKREYGS